jgi:CRP-like cAMP-binding protein
METLSLKEIFIEKIGLQEKQYLEFLEMSKTVSFRKKDFLLKNENVCSFIGFVEKGVIRSYIQKDEEEFNNDFYFENSFVSAYRSFLTQTPAHSSIQALADVSIRIITYSQIRLLESASDVWYKFGKYISDELFIRKCRRETSFLRDTAKERYEQLIQLYPNLEQLVPQYQIASYLRVKPESLSRIKALTYINKK